MMHGGKKIEPLKRLSSFARRFKKSKTFQEYKEIWIGLAVVVVVGLIAGITFLSTVDRIAPEEGDGGLVGRLIDDSTPRHPLTGEALEQKLNRLPQVFGIMVENSADAWPLAGLDEAFLVIEAPVEGSIPRFIVFFDEESEVKKVGPVRSARPYYLDWNDELDAVYLHVGGSPEALDLIANEYETIDLNQFWQSEYFWRQTVGRYAPHNVYTSAELFVSALDELDLNRPRYDAWKFKEDDPVEEGGRSLSVNFTDGTTYDVEWRYQSETNTYNRYQGMSVMHLDDGSTVEANNVAVIATDIRVIDNEGRKSLVTVGEGDAMLVQDGRAILCRWKKESRTDRLRFYKPGGEEIEMNAGVTWIEVVSSLSQAETHE